MFFANDDALSKSIIFIHGVNVVTLGRAQNIGLFLGIEQVWIGKTSQDDQSQRNFPGVFFHDVLKLYLGQSTATHLPFVDVAHVGMLSTHRILAYTFLSVLAVSLTVINALRNYSNFYSVAIYLSKSSRSVLVLANFGFLLALLCGHFVQRLFFGSLRPAEIEVCSAVIIVSLFSLLIAPLRSSLVLYY